MSDPRAMQNEPTIVVPLSTLRGLLELFDEAWECAIEGYDMDGETIQDSAKASGLVRARTDAQKAIERCNNCPDDGEVCTADCLEPAHAIVSLNFRLANIAKESDHADR